MHMRRTTILAEERLLAEVNAVARRRGVSTSHAIREALERYVAGEQAEEQPLPVVVGMFAWEGEPTGEHAEEILAREWPAAIAEEDDDAKTSSSS